MDKIAVELQDSVVDLTRQLTELQALYDSTRTHHLTRMQALDQRELQLQARELKMKSEVESVRERWSSAEIRERELEERAEKLEVKEVEREEQLGLLEKSVEERERRLDELHESLEEQRKHSKALQEVLEEQLGSVSRQMSQCEEKARGIGLELVGGCGLELESCEMGAVLNAGEVMKLIGAISRSSEIVKLCQGVDSADKMRDVISFLIERKQLIEAVRFICTFKLTDEFPPKPLLNEVVEDAEMWWSETFSQKKSLVGKENAVDDRITNLRAVVQCVKDYNLHSKYSLADTVDEISELENLKENLHSVASLDIMMKTKRFGNLKEKREVVLCLPSHDIQHQRKRRKPSTCTPSFRTFPSC